MKKAVHDFWEKASCGEDVFLQERKKQDYLEQSRIRYELDPYIPEFAEFHRYRGKRVLEIGVGLGADHQKFAETNAILDGIDLTQRAIDHTQLRFDLFGLTSRLSVGDAEDLQFEDELFDLVYSWGVLHHSPDTEQAINEAYRVLKPGGKARVMIYHKHSLVGYMLWARYALLRLRPMTPLVAIYSNYLESPGTKAYSVAEGRQLFNRFRNVEIQTVLGQGDLLSPQVGQRHRGILLSLAQKIWPRPIIRRWLKKYGLIMMIKAVK